MAEEKKITFKNFINLFVVVREEKKNENTSSKGQQKWKELKTILMSYLLVTLKGEIGCGQLKKNPIFSAFGNVKRKQATPSSV